MMTDYRVLCTASNYPTAHRHVTEVGTGIDPDEVVHHWTVDEVLTSMDHGDRFYTFFRGETAIVEPYRCSCGYETLRSAGDGSAAHGLRRSPECAHARAHDLPAS
jgi:hypothetical protein